MDKYAAPSSNTAPPAVIEAIVGAESDAPDLADTGSLGSSIMGGITGEEGADDVGAEDGIEDGCESPLLSTSISSGSRI